MTFLDKFVLPQSAEHIELLHYMLLLVQFLFIPFISLIFGGTLFSIFFKRKYEKGSDRNYEILSKEFINTSTINKSIGVILGIVPLIAIILMYAQLLTQSGDSVLSYLLVSFLFLLPAIILIYTYRYSFNFSQIFEPVHQSPNEFEQEDFLQLKSSAIKLASKTGRNGLIFLFFSMWFFIAGLTQANNVDTIKFTFVSGLFSFPVIIRLFLFIFFALAFAGSTLLFSFFYWEGGNKKYSNEIKNFVKEHTYKVTLWSSISLPLFILLTLINIPSELLSGSIFGFSIISLLLIFISYHSIYSLNKGTVLNAAGVVFYSLLFALLSLIIKDQLVMANATKTHSLILASQYDKYLADLKGETGIVAVSGQDIFNTRCSACHKFDVKLVGPPYKETLPKYEGKLAQLVAFIKNPVKVNAAYPPMPNPGLKPNEAEAVAKYILETYKK